MSLAEKIAQEAQSLPDELAHEVLDFIVFLEKRHAALADRKCKSEPDWSVVSIDTRGWRFNREEANAR